ncbi:hypothetical protein Tco_1069529, partial [Tanacetum coccineum]
LKLDEKFRELREEVSTVVNEWEVVIKEIERLHGNHLADENARLMRRAQRCHLEKVTRL